MKQSITKKLRKLFILNAVVIIFLIVGSFSAFEIMALKNRTVNNLSTLANLVSENVSAAIVFDDKKTMSDILNSLKQVSQIYASIITDKKGTVLAYYTQPGVSKKDINECKAEAIYIKTTNKTHDISMEGLQFYKEIVFNNEVIGVIHLFDDLSILKETLGYYALISVFLIFMLLSLIFFLSDKQQLIFTRPILTLKKAMDKITQDNVYDIQVDIVDEDEIGDLIAGFNSMIREVDRRGKEIEENNKLEEEKNKEYVKKLEEARIKAEELSHAKSLFVANMSHEIRTPMNGVMGIIELLGNTSLDDRQKEYVQIAKESSGTLLSIINDILDFSKIEANQLKLENLPFDLRKIVEQTSIQFNVQAHKKGLELLCNFPPNLHDNYSGDELKIKQILHNLISNAIKFTQVGQVEVGIDKIVDVGEGNNQVFLYVKDTGNGINPEYLDKIFNPFDQGDNSTTRKFGGTGLGLSICKNMIKMMKGEIFVESVLGVGTVFNVMIELKRNNAVKFINGTKIDFKNHRALIIDDNLVNCHIVSAYLKSWGIENHFLTNPLEGMAFLKKSAEDNLFCDVVILDHYMPEMSGLELSQKMREIYLKKDLTLILLSSIGGDYHASEDTVDSPFDGFLSKPISSEKLLLCISTVLSNRDQVESQVYQDSDMMMLTKESVKSMFNCKILVAEDYEINQKVIRMMLESLGCQVTIANNGEEAFKLYQENIYDLVFMDCQMPVLDGFDATKKIRVFEQKIRKKTTIVALTANVTQKDKEQCLQSGMDYFVTKPFSEKDLVYCLQTFVKVEDKNKIAKTVEIAQVNKPESDSVSDIVLDREYLNKLLSLNKDSSFSKEIVGLFLSSTPEKIKIILDALASEQYEEIRRITHMLKSSSAMLGAQKLTKLLKEIEAAIKEKEYGNASLKCQSLHAVFEVTSSLLQPYC